MIIDSRIGRQEIDEDRIIYFSRGLIGFEHLRQYVLLQIGENSPMLLLQSTEDPAVGLLVADPYSFASHYKIDIGNAEQLILQAEERDDIAVLVTVSIPMGKPEDTSLNMLGPIVINHVKKVGLQIPQTDTNTPPKFYINRQQESGLGSGAEQQDSVKSGNAKEAVKREQSDKVGKASKVANVGNAGKPEKKAPQKPSQKPVDKKK